jgi:phosphoribosylaminoimidazole carboxylase (NCAIR synthetase)
VRVAQDRNLEKAFFAGNGFAVAPFRALLSESDCARLDPDLLPES